MRSGRNLRRLRALPFQDLGFAKVDHHRHLRQGFPEVIYGEGKTDEQVVAIAEKLAGDGSPVLITRTTPSCFQAIASRWSRARFHEAARAIVIPETIDAIRALTGLAKEAAASVTITDRTLGIGALGHRPK